VQALEEENLFFSKRKKKLLALLPEDVGNFVPFPLSANVGSQLFLSVLKGTLVLAYSQEFCDTLLIGSKSCDLLDDLANDPHPLGKTLERNGTKSR